MVRCILCRRPENLYHALDPGRRVHSFYTVTEIVRGIVSGEVQDLFGRQRMERNLSQLENHVIVCGYGRVGNLVCQEFSRNSTLSSSSTTNRNGWTNSAWLTALPSWETPPPMRCCAMPEFTGRGRWSRDGFGRRQPVHHDERSPAQQGYLPVARVEQPDSEIKLRRAGANRVVSPYLIGGHRLAHAVLRPAVWISSSWPLARTRGLAAGGNASFVEKPPRRQQPA